ncbi:MAG: hypothetical protein IKE03_00750, partial [Blautia sp.]|nr:hypothetical protein [Blautia sp.]
PPQQVVDTQEIVPLYIISCNIACLFQHERRLSFNPVPVRSQALLQLRGRSPYSRRVTMARLRCGSKCEILHGHF